MIIYKSEYFKTILLFLLLIFNNCISAQSYAEALKVPFEGLYDGSVAIVDVDGDNDQDVMMTGLNGADKKISKLYINDGQGNFTEMPHATFDGVYYSSIAFADIDQDNDQDLLMTGLKGQNKGISKLFLNDGIGNFTELKNSPIEEVWLSSVVFGDVDGDVDQDVLVSGRNSSNEKICKLYLNEGDGTFVEVMNTPFEGIFFSSTAFSDIDEDGDLDIIIAGVNDSDIRIFKIYQNDGHGGYTEKPTTLFENIGASTFALTDVNGDNYEDLIVSGGHSLDVYNTKLYINDGKGNFTELTNTNFEGVISGSIAFGDVDGDDDKDLFISGSKKSHEYISKLYINDGHGNYSEVVNTPFAGVSNGAAVFSDINGDKKVDLIIAGYKRSVGGITKLYLNRK